MPVLGGCSRGSSLTVSVRFFGAAGDLLHATWRQITVGLVASWLALQIDTMQPVVCQASLARGKHGKETANKQRQRATIRRQGDGIRESGVETE